MATSLEHSPKVIDAPIETSRGGKTENEVELESPQDKSASPRKVHGVSVCLSWHPCLCVNWMLRMTLVGSGHYRHSIEHSALCFGQHDCGQYYTSKPNWNAFSGSYLIGNEKVNHQWSRSHWPACMALCRVGDASLAHYHPSLWISNQVRRFLIGGVCVALPFGRLYGMYDTKWLYIISVVLFMAGSALCGGAPNIPALIIGRVVAGAGGNGMYVGVVTLLSVNTTEKERPTYLGLM